MTQFSQRFNSEHSCFQFGDFILDLERGALFRQEQEVGLRPKTFDLLVYLVLRNGKLVSKTQLLDAIWGEVVVTEDSVSQCIREIRQALNDESRALLRTVPRRGYMFDADVLPVRKDGVTEIGIASGKPVRVLFNRGVLAGFALLAGGLLAYWLIAVREPPQSGQRTEAAVFRNAIAVLPFEDLSATQDQEYIGHGIAEEIITYLATRTNLRVVAITSSLSLDAGITDIAVQGKRLNAAHILKGSVRRDGETIRVTAKLIDVTSGFHRWSESFDREVNDLFLVQAEIGRSVARAVKARLSPGPELRPNLNADVYKKYFKAQQLIGEFSGAGAMAAEALLKEVISEAPDFAPAWTALAEAYQLRSLHELASEAARAALKIEPDNALALSQMGLSGFIHIGGLASAADYINLAVELAPGDVRVLSNAAVVSHKLGRLDMTIALLRRIVELDPLCRSCLYRLARSLLNAGYFGEAEEKLRILIETHAPDGGGGEHSLGLALLMQGKPDEAMEMFLQRKPRDEWVLQGRVLAHHALGQYEISAELFTELEETWGDRSPMVVAQVHAHLGQLDAALKWLRLDLEGRKSSSLIHLRSPLFWGLQDNPRWQAALEEMGFSDRHFSNIELRIPEFL